MEQRLTIITLGVEDLQRSMEFYEKTLGWKRVQEENDQIAFFQLNGIMLALFPANQLARDASVDPQGSGFKKFSLAYNTRSEKEVDDLFKELETKGVKIAKRPEKAFWGGYSGYFADPDDNLWEVAYNPSLKLDEKGNVTP